MHRAHLHHRHPTMRSVDDEEGSDLPDISASTPSPPSPVIDIRFRQHDYLDFSIIQNNDSNDVSLSRSLSAFRPYIEHTSAHSYHTTPARARTVEITQVYLSYDPSRASH